MSAPQNTAQQAEPLLSVQDLHVAFDTPRGRQPAVNGVTLRLDRGRTLALVGESGSGKSVTARAIMGLVPQPPGQVSAATLRLDGEDLLQLSPAQMRQRRGRKVAMVFQDPMRSLNPTMRIGAQIAEGVRAHRKDVSRGEAKRRAVELLDAVRMPAAARRVDAYPHELSGGMRQRAMIAISLASDPMLLIADEPTTALDVTVQAQILDLLDELRTTLGMAIILVTHDLGVAAEHTDEVAVMYAGRIVEQAPTPVLFREMRMPYTRALLDSIPTLDTPSHALLNAIPGRPPTAAAVQQGGCPFLPRCPRAARLSEQDRSRCRNERPELGGDDPQHTWACWYPLATHDDAQEMPHGR